jgi:hypothetical protein
MPPTDRPTTRAERAGWLSIADGIRRTPTNCGEVIIAAGVPRLCTDVERLERALVEERAQFMAHRYGTDWMYREESEKEYFRTEARLQLAAEGVIAE